MKSLERAVQCVWDRVCTLWSTSEFAGKTLDDHRVGTWTKAIFETVAATEFPPDVAPGRLVPYGHRWKGKDHGEYMVDLALSIEEGQVPLADYRGLFLAMECELSDASLDGRWTDFVKLADIRADMKVFLGAVPRDLGMPEMKRFVDQAAAFLRKHRHVQGRDVFLIMLFDKNGEGALHGWSLSGDVLRELRKA